MANFTRHHSFSILSSILVASALVACGGSGDDTSATTTGTGGSSAGGTSSGKGGAAGKAGSGGGTGGSTAGAAGTTGTGGSAGATGGSSGKGGSAGSTGGSAGATGGSAGKGGSTGGSAGATGGSSGKGGSAGATGGSSGKGGSAGSTGGSAGATGGSSGKGGSAGSTGGSAGSAGATGGSGGSAGAAAGAGGAGAGGSAGAAGNAGSAGSGGGAAPTCSDTIKNQDETDVDCGGATCGPCGDGKGCAAATDCTSGVCDAGTGTCSVPSCTDTVKNGTEVNVDCGGGACPGCGDGQACTAAADCASGNCFNNVCAPTPTAFGTGSDGPLDVPAATTTTIDTIATAATATAGTSAIDAADATGFAAGQIVLIHQSQGNGAGNYELAAVASVVGNMINLGANLTHAYDTGAQVIVVPQYTDVTVEGTLVAPAWNGTTGGILAFQASGSVTVAAGGAIDQSGRGFRGGNAIKGACVTGFTPVCGHVQGEVGTPAHYGQQGEGVGGPGAKSNAANTSGGGGGLPRQDDWGGGGGAYALVGGNGAIGSNGNNCGFAGDPVLANNVAVGGGLVGAADLSLGVVFGGGGGEGGPDEDGAYPGPGGNGGGVIAFMTPNLTVLGAIKSNGVNGQNGVSGGTACGGGGCGMGGGGAGAGGAIRIIATSASLGSGLVTASGGLGGSATCNANDKGGAGSVGRIGIKAGTVTGTSTPAFDTNLDNRLVGSGARGASRHRGLPLFQSGVKKLTFSSNTSVAGDFFTAPRSSAALCPCASVTLGTCARE
jgi:hypothetical protein